MKEIILKENLWTREELCKALQCINHLTLKQNSTAIKGKILIKAVKINSI